MTDFYPVVGAVICCFFYYIAEFLQQLNQLFVTAMYISDNIEGTMQLSLIVIELLPYNRSNGISLFFRPECVEFYKAFFFYAPEGTL